MDLVYSPRAHTPIGNHFRSAATGRRFGIFGGIDSRQRRSVSQNPKAAIIRSTPQAACWEVGEAAQADAKHSSGLPLSELTRRGIMRPEKKACPQSERK